MAGVLFEDIFNVKDIDPEGKKFDRGNYYALLQPVSKICRFHNRTSIVTLFVWVRLRLDTS